MHVKFKHLLTLGSAILYLAVAHLTALAQELTPTPLTITPTAAPPVRELPPGDTTILVIAAGILVLIVFGTVVWFSKRST